MKQNNNQNINSKSRRKGRTVAEFNPNDQFRLTDKARRLLAVDRPIQMRLSPLGQAAVVGNFVPMPEPDGGERVELESVA